LRDVAQMVSDTYANGEYVKEIEDEYLSHCHYDYAACQLVWDGDKLIHHWGVWGYQMRVDGVLLKVGGIGAVITQEDYRKQGIMAQAAKSSFVAMKELGYDLSVLRGKHYVKFGYGRAWNYVTYLLKPDGFPDYGTPPEYQLLEQKNLEESSELYNRDYSSFSGTAVRPTYEFIDSEIGLYGWFDADGKLAGYVRARFDEERKALVCHEGTGDPKIGISIMMDLFHKGEYKTLAFFTLPEAHPILGLLRLEVVVVEDRYFSNSGWRVKIISLESALRKLLPVLEKRIRKSYLKDWHGSLSLDIGAEQVTIEILQSKINLLLESSGDYQVQGDALIARFLIGADTPREIIQQAEYDCPDEILEILTVLFPYTNPVLSHRDEY